MRLEKRVLERLQLYTGGLRGEIRARVARQRGSGGHADRHPGCAVVRHRRYMGRGNGIRRMVANKERQMPLLAARKRRYLQRPCGVLICGRATWVPILCARLFVLLSSRF